MFQFALELYSVVLAVKVLVTDRLGRERITSTILPDDIDIITRGMALESPQVKCFVTSACTAGLDTL
jgi:hypothetical protein